MGRPPLSLGTYGRIATERVPGGYKAVTRYRDLDGRTRRVTRVGPTPNKAVTALKEALRDRQHVGSGSDVTPATKVSTLAEGWFTEVRNAGRSPGTLQSYREILSNYVLPQLGDLRGGELRTPVLDRRLTQVRADHGPGTARITRTVLSGICGYAARQGALRADIGNPVRDVARVRTRRVHRPVALDVTQARLLRQRLAADPTAVARAIPAMVDFLLGTGERIGEALAVTASAFDSSAGTVEVRGTVLRIRGHGLMLKPEPKTENGFRKLLLPSWAASLVRDRLAAHSPSDIRIFDGYAPDGEVLSHLERHTLLFPSLRYRKICLRDPSNISHQINHALTTAGFPHLTSHAFRKTVASLMDDAGLPIRHAADQLGHSKVSMTSDVYYGRKVASTEAARVLEALDG